MSGIDISAEDLSAEALRGLIEEFVTRDGTDYGRVKQSVEQKIEQVRAQLASGEVRIVFGADTETANLVTARDLAASSSP
jgi:uncharacterized protein YheU (UPF0270 family)